jgi:FkbM family methyltransferase
VGANEGEFVHELRRHGYEEDVISAEPRRAAFSKLARRAARDPRWTACHLAFGPGNAEVLINVASNGVSSSLLPMHDNHTIAAPGSAYVGVERVPQRRMDDVILPRLSRSARLSIKLDVQGYESSVLDGAVHTLRHAVALQLELSLAPLYEGQADWRQLMARLRHAGFELWSVDPVLWDPATGRTLQVDVVLARDGLDPASLTP